MTEFSADRLFAIATPQLSEQSADYLLATATDFGLRRTLIKEAALSKPSRAGIAETGNEDDLFAFASRSDLDESERLDLVEVQARRILDPYDRREFRLGLLEHPILSEAALLRLASSSNPEIFGALASSSGQVRSSEKVFMEVLWKLDFTSTSRDYNYLLSWYMRNLPSNGLPGSSVDRILTTLISAGREADLLPELLAAHLNWPLLWDAVVHLAEQDTKIKDEVAKVFLGLWTSGHVSRFQDIPSSKNSLATVISWIPAELHPKEARKLSLSPILSNGTQDEASQCLLELSQDFTYPNFTNGIQIWEVWSAVAKNPNLDAAWYSGPGLSFAVATGSVDLFSDRACDIWLADKKDFEMVLDSLRILDYSHSNFGATGLDATLLNLLAGVSARIARLAVDSKRSESPLDLESLWGVVQTELTDDLLYRNPQALSLVAPTDHPAYRMHPGLTSMSVLRRAPDNHPSLGWFAEAVIKQEQEGKNSPHSFKVALEHVLAKGQGSCSDALSLLQELTTPRRAQDPKRPASSSHAFDSAI